MCPYEQIDGVAMDFLWALDEPTCRYEQIDGAAMGSPSGPVLANVSL